MIIHLKSLLNPVADDTPEIIDDALENDVFEPASFEDIEQEIHMLLAGAETHTVAHIHQF